MELPTKFLLSENIELYQVLCPAIAKLGKAHSNNVITPLQMAQESVQNEFDRIDQDEAVTASFIQCCMDSMPAILLSRLPGKPPAIE